MNPSLRLVVLTTALAAAGCQRAQAPSVAPAAAVRGGTYAVREWLLPTTPGSAQPDLVATRDGRLLLSWISSVRTRRTALQFIEYDRDGRWQSAPRTIAVGDLFYVNWADTPHIAATDDGALSVHWLQKTGAAPDAYGVMLSRSRDGGVNWSAPALVNSDDAQVEHGFASLWPQSADSLGVAWIDGGDSHVQAAHDRGHSAQARPSGMPSVAVTSLRSAIFSGELRRSGDREVDASACECCQTDVAVTARGPLLVYRDRTADEVRDIHATRRDGDDWTKPMPVHVDGWKMPACPVNGPAVAAHGNNAVVAWYTAADGQPMVKLARSSDAGDSFADAVTLDTGDAIQGRVDVALDDTQAVVAWVREDAGGQSLWLARYAPDLSRQLARVQVALLQGRGKGTGFPRLALRDGDAFLVWTDVIDGAPQLRGAVYGRH